MSPAHVSVEVRLSVASPLDDDPKMGLSDLHFSFVDERQVR